MTDDLLQRQADNIQLLKTAERTGQTLDWIEYKNKKTLLDKDISKRQTKYINDRLDNTNDRWKTLKDITKTNKSDPSWTIVHNNKVIYNLTDIIDIANNFYIEEDLV